MAAPFPASPTTGQIYQSPSGVTYVYDGTSWVGQYNAAFVTSKTSTTGSSVLPTGTTADRGTPSAGYLRWNTSLTQLEVYDGVKWYGLSGLGQSQLWQDFSASRALGVTYTNTTGLPIQINVEVQTDAFSAGGGVYVSVNGIVLGPYWAEGPAVTTSGATAIVPPGATYRADPYGAVSLIQAWRELR